MDSNEQGIIKMLQDKINDHEQKISSFRHAISALSGESASSSSAKPGKRRGRKPGSKNKIKPAAVKATPVKKAASKSGAVKSTSRKTRSSKVTPAKSKPVSKSRATKGAASTSTRLRSAKPKAAKKARKARSGETMEGWVLNQFEDGTPKTARTLMDMYNKATGKKLEMNGFSARLAIIKKKGTVKSMKNDTDGLSYNGRSEWFDNGKLKKEYLPKG